MTQKQTIKILQRGGIGILPTDTIYGLVGQALLPETVERIYEVRQRQPDKPMIILISSLADLALFNIKTDEETNKILNKFWPGPVSVVLDLSSPYEGEDTEGVNMFSYLHRGTNALAFRLPQNKKLSELLKQTGPLVAPSANPEGREPAKTIAEAKKYFSTRVDFYLDGGKLEAEPSTLIKIENGKIKVLRQGVFSPPL